MIPYGRQDITEADLEAVRNVLLSDFITQGPAIPEFEAGMANYCGAAHAVAVNSATAALHLACMALDLGPGDILWTSPNTFVASSNVGLYCGAEVDFIDIDPVTYNMSTAILEERLQDAERLGRLPKIVMPVHFAGQSCDMEKIAELGKKYGFRIIEDASHAVGGRYQEKPVGSCHFSDITVFSFHPVKIITTGEGGMALTNNPDLAERMQLLRSHGISRDPKMMRGAPEGPWYYQQHALGYNFRMTELQAALGSSQLTRLDQYIEARHQKLQTYHRELADLPIILPSQADGQRSSLHLYPILTGDDSPLDRAEAFENLRALGIGVNVLYIPVYLQPYYQDLGFTKGHCPNAEAYYARTIALPMFATLTQADQEQVIRAMHKIFAG